MKININDVMVFNVEEGEGKNGYFANAILLDMENKSKLEIFIKQPTYGKMLKEREGSIINLCIDLIQNKFGLMFGEIMEVM